MRNARNSEWPAAVWMLPLACCAGPLPRGMAADDETVDLRDAATLFANSNGTAPCGSPDPNCVCPPHTRPDASWENCPFPARADEAKVDEALVTLRVVVSPLGTAESVGVLSDPGYDFGPAAAICAFNHKYVPAHYADGRTVTGMLKLRVRFSRPPPPGWSR